MMTTESTQDPRSTGFSLLLGAAVAALVFGGLLSLVGAFTAGSAAAYGALVGSLLVLGVFGLGSFVVNVVAGLMPSAALLVALMTYTLQVIGMALIFVGLSGSGLLGEELSREWLAGSVIGGTMVWLIVQILLTVRVRVPIYDLSESTDSQRPEASAQ